MIITRRTASRKPKKQLRQAHLGKKTATVSFDEDNILTLDYTPSTFRTVLEDVPDNRRSDFILGQSGGGGSVLISKTITANGIYDASDDNADGYDSVNVNVPQGVFPSGTVSITSNGTTDVTNYVYASVNVPNPSTGTKTVSISSNGTTTEDVTNYASVQINTSVPNPSTGTLSVTANGTYDVTNYASADVSVPNPSTGTKTVSISSNGTTTEDVTNYANVQINASVPNTYTAGDEGKVVSSGALVSQSSATYTANNTYDTTLINSVTVNVSGYTIDDIATNTEPSGAITLGNGVTTIGNYALTGKPITSITAPSVTSIGTDSLQNTNITDIDDVNFPSLGVSSYYTILLRMSSLQHIKLSGEYLSLASGSGAMRYNDSILTAEFPNCAKSVAASLQGVGSNAFYGLKNMTLLDAGFITNISNGNAFYNCNALRTLVLRNASVVTLGNIGAFTNTPFRGYNSLTGVVYVPSSLISSYQSATNWSTLYSDGYCTFSAIEGSIYE